MYLARMRAGPAGRKVRPVLIVSPDVRNRWASDLLVIPLSTKVRPAPTHVLLDRGEGGLPHPSVVKCEQVTCLDRSLLEARPLGRPLSEDRMRQVEDAILIALGIFT
jgi:mRNA-degrading endonuclease toxin of MazEF toxin-antitoxin module